jgi:dimethylhistidine N-methyltransferase
MQTIAFSLPDTVQASAQHFLTLQPGEMEADSRERVCLLTLQDRDALSVMRHEVAEGLASPRRRSIPPTYFYDETGSQLYEAITRLPEYYPTRTEAALLKTVAPELARWVQPGQLVELGSGSSTKTRILFDAFFTAQPHAGLVYVPIDVSATMMRETADQLVAQYSALRVLGLISQFETGIACLNQLPSTGERLIVFLGGTLGNFTPAYQTWFFRHLSQSMQSGERLLLGFDRCPHPGKPVERIVAAYNDAQGVTAAFNRNLLTHLNHALGAQFDASAWRHEAIYNAEAHQIEMYLVSQLAQQVSIEALEQTVAFEAGERILTEISRKFDPEALGAWFTDCWLDAEQCWSDPEGLFGLLLLRKR